MSNIWMKQKLHQWMWLYVALCTCVHVYVCIGVDVCVWGGACVLKVFCYSSEISSVSWEIMQPQIRNHGSYKTLDTFFILSCSLLPWLKKIWGWTKWSLRFFLTWIFHDSMNLWVTRAKVLILIITGKQELAKYFSPLSKCSSLSELLILDFLHPHETLINGSS